MTEVLLDTTGFEEAERVLSERFSRTRLIPADRDEPTPAQLSFSTVGSLGVADLQFGYDLAYESEPTERINVFRLRAGNIVHTTPAGPMVFWAGEVGALPLRPDHTLSGRILNHAHYDVVSLDRSLLSRVATGLPPEQEAPLALASETTTSREANAYMANAIDHVVHVATSETLRAHRLAISALEQYVAAALLAAFPHSPQRDPSAEDRSDSTPVLLRRALAYIDDHAHTDITTADIAEAIYVTPRALQYMFRKHRDCTPTDHLRRVRLHNAHLELIAADRSTTTVGEVARHWGFLHTGRFAVYYRQHYGQSPHDTLRG
jgi:AraC-like DNA-binding protein